MNMVLKFLKNLLRDEKVKDLEDRIEELEGETDYIRYEVNELSSTVPERLDKLDERTERNKDRITQIESDLDESEETPAEWTQTETQVLAVLFDAERYLTNQEIGERLPEFKSGDKVRPIINRIKNKIDVLEQKKGRAKAYKLPRDVEDEFLENQNLKIKK